MKTIHEIKELQKENEAAIHRNESETRSAHAQLVNATRENNSQGVTLGDLVNAEAVLRVRGEALRQIRGELAADLKAAEIEASSKEAQARSKAIKALEGDLEAAAREAAKQFAALEKTVFAAIDEKHAELQRLVNSDRNLSAQEVSKITQGNKAFRYLYELYIYIKRDQARKDMLAGFERAAKVSA